jgi:hypothetical protein
MDGRGANTARCAGASRDPRQRGRDLSDYCDLWTLAEIMFRTSMVLERRLKIYQQAFMGTTTDGQSMSLAAAEGR